MLLNSPELIVKFRNLTELRKQILKEMKLIILLLITSMSIFSSKKVRDAKVYLEDISGTELIAFQKTGEEGKVAFKYLDAGKYRILIDFPQQRGKWVEEKSKHSTLTKASYNAKTKSYFYQGYEGFFMIEFEGIKNIESENFGVVFKEDKDEEEIRIVLVEFIAGKDNANITVSVKAITASQFKKYTDKAENDISMFSIQGIK